MLETNPTICFSIGVDESNRKKMRANFADVIENNQLLLIPLDSLLFEPVFANTKDSPRNLRTRLKEWIKYTGRIEQYVKPFLEELVREQYRKELEQLKKEIERIKAVSWSDPPTEEKTPYF